MELVYKKTVLLLLIILSVAIFELHWFFIPKNMPAAECLSTECIYSPLQASPAKVLPEDIIFLNLALILIVVTYLHTILTKISAIEWLDTLKFLKKEFLLLFDEFIFWIKILKKRDSYAI